MAGLGAVAFCLVGFQFASTLLAALTCYGLLTLIALNLFSYRSYFIFQFTTNGAFATLYATTNIGAGFNTSPVQGPDGTLYGTEEFSSSFNSHSAYATASSQAPCTCGMQRSV